MGLFTRDGYLESAEMRKRLLSENIEASLVDLTLQKFWFKDSYNSLISYEPYFEIFITYIKKEGSKFNLLSFYDYLLKTLLPNNYIDLGDLALIYEQTHLNQIEEASFDIILSKKNIPFTKDDLISSQVMEKIQDEKTNKTFIGWKHHRLSEYIVASMFLNKDDPISEFEKYAVFSADTIKAIKPSWLGVYYFLSQTDVRDELLDWTVKFLEKNNNSITEDISEYITNIEGLSKELRTKLFNLVYNHYKAKEIWFPVWARVGLGKIATPEVLPTLEEDIKEQEYFERTYNYRGNVVAVMDSVLENNVSILTTDKKDFWKKTFVGFAKDKDERGVLHRQCLAALTNFKDSSLIPELSNTYIKGDSLVKQAYIQFCYNTAPNSKDTIDVLLNGFNPSTDIYARHGLYEVSSLDGIKYLLAELTKRPDTLAFLIDRESIFNGENDKGDQKLIGNITFNLDTNTDIILPLLESLLLTISVATKDIYQLDKSYILKSLSILVASKDPSFWKVLINDFKSKLSPESNIWAKWDKYEDLLVWFVNEDNLEEIHKSLGDIKDGDTVFEYLVRRNEWRTGDTLIVDKAAELGYVSRIEKVINPHDETKAIYEKFRNLLEPEPGKYRPEVFAFYLRNFDVVSSEISNDIDSKEKIKKLIFESNLKLIKPRDFKVNYEDSKLKKGRYTINSIHFYYGNLLRLANKLYPEELKQYRQQIIDYLPLAFNEDLQTIMELAPNIKEDELSFVFSTLLDKEKDIRYLIPDTFSYFVSEYVEKGITYKKFVEILKSFIEDPLIDDYVKRSSLRNLITIDKKTKTLGSVYFKELFESDSFVECKNIANEALISIYQDEEAIKWRLSSIKNTLKTAMEYTPPKMGDVHEVSAFEHELHDLDFAKPLFDIGPEYLPKFIELLKFAINKDTSNSHSFVDYVWKINLAYVKSLALNFGIKYFIDFSKDIEKIISTNSSYLWFRYALDRDFGGIVNKGVPLEGLLS